MKALLAMGLISIMFLANRVQAANDTATTQAEIDKAMASLGSTMKELTALDDSDKKIAESNRRQIETKEMLDRQENKIKSQLLPELQMRAQTHDREQDELIKSGCPANGGTVPKDLADRCNPPIERLNTEYTNIMNGLNSIKQQVAEIAAGRQAITETTLANAKQQKANDALRQELLAAKKLQEGILLDLRKKTESCQKLLRQRGVTCEKLKLRCGMVQFDGADPDLPPSTKDTPCGAKVQSSTR